MNQSKYTPSDLDFILYNNRSIEGVIQNFLFEYNYDGYKLYEIDQIIAKYKRKWKGWKTYEIRTKNLDVTAEDIHVYPQDLVNLTQILYDAHDALLNDPHNYNERRWLYCRRVNDDIIKEWKLGSLQYLINLNEPKILEYLGISTHPLLSKLLNTTLDGGGIVIPYFENDVLKNCDTRRIKDTGKLKYTQAVPDINVRGIQHCKNVDEIYICEGTFDMFAINYAGRKAVTVGSSMWSSPQLYELISLKPKTIKIFADKDKVGLSSAVLLQEILLNLTTSNVITVVSNSCKDAADHFFVNKLSWSEVEEIQITKEMIDDKEEVTFDVIEYLSNRKFE